MLITRNSYSAAGVGGWQGTDAYTAAGTRVSAIYMGKVVLSTPICSISGGPVRPCTLMFIRPTRHGASLAVAAVDRLTITMADASGAPKASFTYLLNKQLESEYTARQQYIALAVWFLGRNMLKTSEHFFEQSDEENGHATSLIRFMHKNGHSILIPGVKAVENSFENIRDAFGRSLTQEESVQEDIKKLYDAALREGSAEERAFVKKFLEDQEREIGSISELVLWAQRNEHDPQGIDTYIGNLSSG